MWLGASELEIEKEEKNQWLERVQECYKVIQSEKKGLQQSVHSDEEDDQTRCSLRH